MYFYDKHIYFFHNECADFSNLSESIIYFRET